jgi:uncharacterized protein (DUF305 family)
MPRLDRSIRCVATVLAAASCGLAASASLAQNAAAAFKAENDAAMDKMMAGMSIRPSGDIDRDFAETMIPHHQGAIDMAEAELRHGKNEQLRRIAQEIVVDQQQEIAAMRLALGDPLPASTPSPTQAAADNPHAAAHHLHSEHRQ